MDAALASLGMADTTATTTLAVGGAVAAAAAAVLFSTAARKNTPDNARKIHIPRSTLPVLGNMVDALQNAHRLHDWLSDQSVEFNGEPWRFSIPGQPDQIVLTTPDAIEEVLVHQFDKFPKGPIHIDIISTMFGFGLLSSDGERWYHQRKTATKFFSAKVLRSFLKVSIHKCIGRLDEVLDNAAASGTALDLKKMFHDFTLDTFVEMALGVDLKCIGSSEKNLFQSALDVASPVTCLRFRRPTPYWKLERWLGVGPEGDMARSMDAIYGWLNEIVQQCIDTSIAKKASGAKPDESESSIKTVVELFIESSGDDLVGLQKEDLVDFVLTFVIAARDTTADTLSWFFYILAQHPEVEKKLRQEMAVNLADVADDTFLTTDHTRNMVYLEACIKETLRLYPAVPYMFRQATEDTVLCGDIFLKKGENTGLATFGMGRLTRLWGEDALEFKPDRWIEQTTGKIMHFPATQFVSFSTGPRACIGMSLAMMELRVGLANLLHRFKFDVDYASNGGAYVVSPTLAMKNPLMGRPTRVRGAPTNASK